MNYTILIADDEPQNIKNLFEALNPEIYRVFVAPDGKTAVEQALMRQPDAIIMDWDMPVMNGIDAIRIIRASEDIKNIPIIVATGKMTRVENLRTALKTGANDYIRKPFDPIEIEARVQSMIHLRTEQQKILRLEKEILQQKLETSSRELEKNQQALAAFKAHLAHNNKYIDSVISDLQHIRQIGSDLVKRKIVELISQLKVDIKRVNLNEFENHFENIHPSFLKNIKNRFPDLTQNEMELCMFFRLNMTTNEMLTLTYKTDSTLKKARQRLKKKLGLGTNESLSDFISEIE